MWATLVLKQIVEVFGVVPKVIGQTSEVLEEVPGTFDLINVSCSIRHVAMATCSLTLWGPGSFFQIVYRLILYKIFDFKLSLPHIHFPFLSAETHQKCSLIILTMSEATRRPKCRNNNIDTHKNVIPQIFITKQFTKYLCYYE